MLSLFFKNGSEIKLVKSSNENTRGKRSELVSFYCDICDRFHIDYPRKNIFNIDCAESKRSIVFCRESVADILDGETTNNQTEWLYEQTTWRIYVRFNRNWSI